MLEFFFLPFSKRTVIFCSTLLNVLVTAEKHKPTLAGHAPLNVSLGMAHHYRRDNGNLGKNAHHTISYHRSLDLCIFKWIHKND